MLPSTWNTRRLSKPARLTVWNPLFRIPGVKAAFAVLLHDVLHVRMMAPTSWAPAPPGYSSCAENGFRKLRIAGLLLTGLVSSYEATAPPSPWEELSSPRLSSPPPCRPQPSGIIGRCEYLAVVLGSL